VLWKSLNLLQHTVIRQLRGIHLAIVATVPIIEKYGLNKILEPFIADVNTLSSTGISITVNEVSRTFRGALLTLLADNLGSNDIGGFKKSFSFSYRFCRTCLVTKDSLSSGYSSEEFMLRDNASHLSQLSMLNGPASDHYSITYGINRRSCLLDVENFSLFDGGLPHDVMHDILEGIAPKQIKQLLYHYTMNGLFTLKEFNEKLLNFNYGYTESDKPVPIVSSLLRAHDKTLRGSASQNSLLIRISPLLIADKIPEDDDHWSCFLLLRKIADIVFSPISSNSLCSSLKLLTRDYLRKYSLFQKCIFWCIIQNR
jgi:hypothetical protein